MTKTRQRWGIVLKGTGLLGIAWMRPQLPDHPYTEIWPAIFVTRLEARAMAAHLMTVHHARHGWRFKAVRLTITVTQR